MNRSSASRSKPDLATVGLVVVVAAAAIAACYGPEPGENQQRTPGRGVYIESTWQTARAVNGHKEHVVERKIACSKCHELTQDSIGRVVPSKCAACHAKEARIEHAAERARARFGAAARADCTACHAFTFAGSAHAAGFPDLSEVPSAEDCSRCHSTRQGNLPAVAVHGTSECVKCHRPHDDERPKPGACVECHEDVATTHAAKSKSPIEVCTTCHAHQHAPASEALATCSDCHTQHEPKVPASALFADGHAECVGCHRPHEFERAQAVECRSCHEGMRVLAASRVREHNRCTSCHAPHDVRGSPDKACAGCHQGVHPDHPKHGAAGTCVGCHDPHPAVHTAQALARPCSTCHQAAASDAAFHAGIGCKQCHAPHAFVLEGSHGDVCKNCHAKTVHQAGLVAGHAACERCHGGLPHRPERLLAGCETCHSSVHASATAGHRQCANCHEPHSGSLGKDCRSCHAAEHRTAPAGHQNCTSCHEQHSGSTRQATCSNCHAAQARTAHGRLGTRCNQCHRPHGPEGVAAPPSCTSCHAPTTLSGLHGVREHRDCARCHSGHEDPPATVRQACLGCHTDRKNHFASAPSCSGCHLFEPTR